MSEALYQKVRSLPIYLSDGVALSDAVARDSGLSREQIATTLDEYCRFLVLAAKGPAVPPPLIAAVWCLHRTGSAYEAFCTERLGRAISDPPDRPAQTDGAAYATTLVAYRQTFGTEPFAKVWPTPGLQRAGFACAVITVAGFIVLLIGLVAELAPSLSVGLSLIGGAMMIGPLIWWLVTAPWRYGDRSGGEGGSDYAYGAASKSGTADADGGSDGGGSDGGGGGGD